MAYDDTTDRAVIPGTIRGVTGSQVKKAKEKIAAARQDNMARHFGGPTVAQTVAKKDHDDRLKALMANQSVEDDFRKARGLPVAGATASGTTNGTTPVAPAVDPAARIAKRQKRKADAEMKASAPVAGQVASDAKSGITQRGGAGGADVKFADGSVIVGTPQKRILAGKYGNGGATTGNPAPAAPSSTPPPLTPATLAANVASKLPVIGGVIDKVKAAISGGRKTSAPDTSSSSVAPTPPAAPVGATPTKSGGSMSITGAPKPAPAPVAAPPMTEMQKRDATYKQAQNDAIYPENSAKHVLQRTQNAALVQKYKDGDAAFAKTATPAQKTQADTLTGNAMTKANALPVRDRLRLATRQMHAAA